MVRGLKATRIAEHSLAHVLLGDVTISVYRMAKKQAIALLYGDWQFDGFVPVRLQSACAYGEVLGAADCDCRAQLDAAFEVFKDRHRGILIHLDQEGRGAGLAVKARAYELQDLKQLDTVEAYRALGVTPDQRNYAIAAAIFRDLEVRRVRVLTNNPRKVDQLIFHKLQVEREPLSSGVTRHNFSYLRTKREKLGHDLELFEGPSELSAEAIPR